MTAGGGDGCVCPSDLFECDHTLGCVCPEGVDCGIEGGRDIHIDKLNQEEELSGSTVIKKGSVPVLMVGVISLLVLSVIGGVIGLYCRWGIFIVYCHCSVLYCRRRLSVMNSELVNRTGQHNYSSDSSEVNNQPSLETPGSAEVSPETIVNNPLYVNFNPGNLNINISRQNIRLSKMPKRNVYDDVYDSLKASAPSFQSSDSLSSFSSFESISDMKEVPAVYL